MGHMGDAGHPDVKAAIEDAIRRICASGKAAGFLAPDPDVAKHYLACGANFLAIAVDTMLLTQAMTDALAAVTGVEPTSMAKNSY